MDGLNLQSRKVWVGGSALLAVIIVAAAWLLAIGPERSDTADLHSQTADTVAQNDRLSAQSASLEREKRNLPALRASLARAFAALPAQPELPQFTTALTVAAHKAGVTLTSITVAPVQAPTVVNTAAPAPTASTSSTSSSNTSSTSTTAATAAQLEVPITVQVAGSGENDVAFLDAVRTGARSATVTSAQMTRTDKNTFQLTAQLSVFSAPMSAGQVANLQRLLSAGK